jgi:hypothetical protein
MFRTTTGTVWIPPVHKIGHEPQPVQSTSHSTTCLPNANVMSSFHLVLGLLRGCFQTSFSIETFCHLHPSHTYEYITCCLLLWGKHKLQVIKKKESQKYWTWEKLSRWGYHTERYFMTYTRRPIRLLLHKIKTFPCPEDQNMNRMRFGTTIFKILTTKVFGTRPYRLHAPRKACDFELYERNVLGTNILWWPRESIKNCIRQESEPSRWISFG